MKINCSDPGGKLISFSVVKKIVGQINKFNVRQFFPVKKIFF